MRISPLRAAMMMAMALATQRGVVLPSQIFNGFAIRDTKKDRNSGRGASQPGGRGRSPGRILEQKGLRQGARIARQLRRGDLDFSASLKSKCFQLERYQQDYLRRAKEAA